MYPSMRWLDGLRSRGFRLLAAGVLGLLTLLLGQVDPAASDEVKLTASDASADDWFGFSVSISGDYAVMGSPRDEDAGDRSGSAYVFARSGTSWTQHAKLTASDAAAEDYFGCSVSLSGDYAIVGADLDDDGGTDSGSAYVFVRSGTSWTQQAKLTASDAAAEDYFAFSASLSGDYAVVGSPCDDDGGDGSGSAYVFARSGTSWTQHAKLTASDAAAWDVFGISVSLSGDHALVGAKEDDDGGTNSGSAYVFARSGASWTEQTKLTAGDAGASDWFGESVSLSGDYAVVAARWDDDAGTDSGSAYVFHPLPGPTSVNEHCSVEYPARFRLAQNVPNPFNPTTRIAYDLLEASNVRFGVYTITGQHVVTLVSAPQEAGHYEAAWDATPLASGVYVYTLQAGPSVETRRAILLR